MDAACYYFHRQHFINITIINITIKFTITKILTLFYRFLCQVHMFFNSIELIITPCSQTPKMGEHL